MNALRALLLLLPLVALPGAGLALGTDAARAVPAPQDGDAFMERFRKAMSIGATDEMNRLVRQHEAEAITQVMQTCEAIASGSNDKLEAEIEALRKAWKAVHSSRFADRVYEFFSLLPSQYKGQRDLVKRKFEVAAKQFRAAEKEKDGENLEQAGLAMKGLGDAFRDLGDHYWASQSYLFWALANDEPNRGKDADLKTAHDAYVALLQEREEIDLKDTIYGQTKERQLILEKMGFGDPEKAAPEPGKAQPGPEAPAAAEPATGTLSLTTRFELVTDIAKYRRPIYGNDVIYAAWTWLDLRDTGSSARFGAVADSPNVLRVSPVVLSVDADRDGTGEVEIPLTGNLVPVQTTIGSGDQARPWGFLSAVGGERDTYNGIQYSLAPSKEFMSLYVAPAASLVTELNGLKLRVLDDNMDGVYGSPPKDWSYVGLLEGSFQRDVDSIVVGESSVAIPWSELVQVGGAWYRLQPEANGITIQATRTEVSTGKLKLDLKGVPVDYLIVRGAKGGHENAYFSVTKEGLDVPAGTYELFQGQVAEGKKMQRAKALVLPSKETPSWTVGVGQTVTMELGAPFGFTFEVQQDDESATVVGASVAVVGRAGETYQRPWNCVPHPEASYREAGKKRGSKGEDMRGAESQEELAEDWRYGWFPRDLTFTKKSPGPVEVQLVEKKNKLFGKIESEWR